jgi:hypothetical protein
MGNPHLATALAWEYRAKKAEADYEALLVRFEKACGELTARETVIMGLKAAIHACNLSLKSYEAASSPASGEANG